MADGDGELARAVADVMGALQAAEGAQEPQEAGEFDKYALELARWLDDCRVANGGGAASHDDVFFFFETRYPEALDLLPALFQWISLFMDHVLPSRDAAAQALLSHEPAVEPARDAERAIPEWVPDAVERLETSGDLATVATESGLKSPVTLLYWKNEHAKRELQREHEQAVALAAQDAAVGDDAHSNETVDVAAAHQAALAREEELAQWLLQRQQTQITRQDVMDHIMQTYPAFAAAKTPAALKVWTSRFLKRHLSSSPSSNVGVKRARTSKAKSAAQTTGEAKADSQGNDGKDARVPRKRRGACEGGYVLHSNEFKLNALRKLDEGKSVSEVAQELGLKSQNSLTYWNSIRDKLVTSEKKRFRLAGGGRRSSCTFEGELLLWVSERHQKGLGTDVKAVLDYMHEFHPSFTEGKKEPTLRKWILRFFKRCWRAPPTVTTPQDATKAYIFV